MAVKAYVLIEAEVGKTSEIIQAVQKVEGVKSADTVTGSYDIVATIEVAGLDAVGDAIKKLHSVPGTCKTTTLIAVKYY